MGMNKMSGIDKEYSDNRKRGRRRHKKIPAVQTLYEACKEVFSGCGPGVVPPPDHVHRLKTILDKMTGVDVGIRPNMPFFKSKQNGVPPRITYLHLCDCDKFSIGIFCLPPSAVIPLHNHPGMTVFSKILFGTMHITSFDWVDDRRSVVTPTENTSNASATEAVQGAGVRLAKVKVDSDFTAPCETSILYPAEGGNMHCFTALTPCAVLDVLGPPYCDPEGRHCQYYLNFPFSKFSVDGEPLPVEESEGYEWLEAIEKPESLSVVGGLYSGPKIVEN